MKIHTLIADNWRMDGGVAFGVVPKSIWGRHFEANDNNMVPITTRCILVENNEKKILFDVGFGNKKDEKYYRVRYRDEGVNIISSLAAKGFMPGDITDIVFTHLHDDHVGAATYIHPDGKTALTFENATYWVSENQWKWAINPNKREAGAFFKENLLPLQESGKLHLLQENQQPFDNIKFRFFDGHTRGQIVPFFYMPDGVYVFVADVIPTAFNMRLPYIPSVDIEPLKTLDEKEAFLEEAFENKYIIIFQHDKFNTCCTLAKTEKGIVADKFFTID